MTSELVTAFKAGDPVPEWLVQMIPRTPQAQRVRFCFGVGVHVIDTPDYFLVIPLPGIYPSGYNLFDTGGAWDCDVLAMDKTVRLITQEQYMAPVGVDVNTLAQPAPLGGFIGTPRPLPPAPVKRIGISAEQILLGLAVAAGVVGLGVVVTAIFLAVKLSQ